MFAMVHNSNEDTSFRHMNLTYGDVSKGNDVCWYVILMTAMEGFQHKTAL